jgi:hypothetical protein
MKAIIARPGTGSYVQMAKISVTIAVILAIVAAWAIHRFGSLSKAASYLAGERLLADSRIKTIGTVEVGWRGRVGFSVKNVSNDPVTIFGARSSCTCAVVDAELPVSLPPGHAYTLNVNLNPYAKPYEFSEKIDLFTSCKSQSILTLRVTGRVVGGR